MFAIFAKLLSSIASFLFPLFASYKALKNSDPVQLTPWLMYWVVLACALLVESWTEWFLVWIPLYSYIRLLFLLYLVLPQTQGAQIIYTTYVHPYLQDNESQIEDLIATAHDKMKAAGVAYLKQAIELLRTQVLGMAPSPQAAQSDANSVPAAQRPRSYTQALLDRYWLPAGSNAAVGADFYNFLASAVAAATGATTTNKKENDPMAAASSVPGVGDFPAGDLSASGTLVPPSIRDNADKMSFLAAQRERLNMVLSALDREAASLRSSSSGSGASPSGQEDDVAGATARGLSIERPTTSASGKSGLSKSRSEADFVKIEAESGGEEELDETETARPISASSGSWLPWGWSGAAKAELEKNKDE